MRLLLGIDVSTTGAKALLIDRDGRVVSSATTPLSLSTPHPLWSEQDPHEWWTATVNSITQALATANASGDDVIAIGLTGQMHGAVLLDGLGMYRLLAHGLPGGESYSYLPPEFYREERPVRRENVEGFWIDRFPVTNAEFGRFVSETGYVTLCERQPDAAAYPDADPAPGHSPATSDPLRVPTRIGPRGGTRKTSP